MYVDNSKYLDTQEGPCMMLELCCRGDPDKSREVKEVNRITLDLSKDFELGETSWWKK